MGKFGARAPWPPPIKSMHITHGVWQVRIPRGIAQRDPSIKEEKAKHTNKRHFPRDLPKTMGAEHAERSPHHSKHNPTHTHTKTNHPKRALRKSKWTKNEAATQAKATTHHVKYAFSKPTWGTQRQNPAKSNGILLLSKFF